MLMQQISIYNISFNIALTILRKLVRLSVAGNEFTPHPTSE